jgi:hypothetical protein
VSLALLKCHQSLNLPKKIGYYKFRRWELGSIGHNVIESLFLLLSLCVFTNKMKQKTFFVIKTPRKVCLPLPCTLTLCFLFLFFSFFFFCLFIFGVGDWTHPACRQAICIQALLFHIHLGSLVISSCPYFVWQIKDYVRRKQFLQARRVGQVYTKDEVEQN